MKPKTVPQALRILRRRLRFLERRAEARQGIGPVYFDLEEKSALELLISEAERREARRVRRRERRQTRAD